MPKCLSCSEIGHDAKVLWQQRFWNSLPKLSYVQLINIHSRIGCSATNLGFLVENELDAHNSYSLPNCVCWNEFRICCRSCIVCCEFEIRFQNCVVCSELTFAAELGVLQRIWGLLQKLSCLQRMCSLPNCVCFSEFGNRCRGWIVCNEFVIRSRNWVSSKLTFDAELCVVKWYWGSMPKFYGSNEFEIRFQNWVMTNKLTFVA